MYPLPFNEAERLEALRGLRLVGTPPEHHFDAVCRQACALFGLPIALVSLIEEDRQWFKARCGLDVDGTSREVAFCTYTILSEGVLAVEDATRDERFARNPLVTGAPGIRFYAGAPLELGPGLRIGTLCIIDTEPRSFGEEQRRQLRDLADIVVAHLRLHAAGVEREDELARRRAREAVLEERTRLLALAEQIARVGHWRVSFPDASFTWSPEVYRIHGRDPHGFAPDIAMAVEAYHPEDRERVVAHFRRARQSGEGFEYGARLVQPGGECRDVLVRAVCERGEDGTVSGVFGVVMDVTDMRRAEEELRRTASFLASTLETMDQGLIVIDRDRRLPIISRRAAELLDLPDSLLAGKPGYDEVVLHQISEGEFADADEEVQAFLRSGGLYLHAHVLERTRPNGRVLEVRTVPLEDGGAVRTYTDISERKRAEAALREKTALLDATLDAMDQGLLMVDAEGLVQVCNARAVAMLDLPPATRDGRLPFAALVAHQQRAGEFDASKGGRERWLTPGGDPFAAPPLYERVRPDGTVIEVRTARLPDGGAVRTYTDITERRRAEAAVRESEARYRALADALPQMVWVTGRDGVATYANRGFRDYYGGSLATRAERVARNHPDDMERMNRAWSEAVADGRPFEVEGRLRRRDGVHRWHKLVLLPIRGEDGEVAEWIGTALDIDDIIGAREQLKETTDLLRLAQEAAGAGTWEWSLATGLTRLCAESARMHGLPAEGFAEVSLDAWRARVHPDDVGATSEAMRRAVGTGDVYSAEFRVLPAAAAPAGERWIHAMGRVVCDWDGRPVRMVGLNLDVTERKRAEAALNEAKAAAEAASEAKTEFLASMSHEIRTPLNGVLGYADLLLDDRSLSPDQRRHAERIRSAGNALLVVVDDILDFSKIEAGQVALEHQPFAPASLIDNAVSIVRGLAERKGLRLDVDADPGLPPHLLGDQDRLRQILLNLLNNAVKFTPQGSVTLAVRMEGEPGPARRIRFAVTDTGIGIPEAKRSRLFQRFSQVDGSIQREFGGTGLGLAISKRLVELMGGEIGVASELGRGSTFWFHVSLEPAAAGAPEGGAAAPAGGGRRARILLVEDMPVNQELARAVLEAAGHEVDVAGDGAEAVQAVLANAYDLCLMDIQMPGMDGITATRHIRALGPHPASRLPIVAMTANVLPHQVRAFREAGMDGHVGKPFKRDELYAEVARWAGPGEVRAPHGPARPAPGPALDREAFEAMRDVMGSDRIGALMTKLAGELRGRFAALGSGAADRARLAGDAHAMIAAAGMLGFSALSDLCRELEEACVEGREVAGLLARLEAARRAALAEIETLTAA